MQKPKPQAEVIKAKEPARLAGKTGPNHQTRLRGLEASQASESRCDLCAVFAAAFKRWRLKNNLQLKEIAADLGVSVPTVCTWETGKRFPTGRHFEMLIDYTGLPPCRLFCVMSDKCVPAECLLALPKQSAQAVG